MRLLSLSQQAATTSKCLPAWHPPCAASTVLLDHVVVVQTIINKFPEELVNDWCEVFFLPLVQRLSGDPSSQCREAVGACVKALMLRSAPEPVDKLAQYCLIWLGGGDARLARTAAQVAALLLDAPTFTFVGRVYCTGCNALQLIGA